MINGTPWIMNSITLIIFMYFCPGLYIPTILYNCPIPVCDPIKALRWIILTYSCLAFVIIGYLWNKNYKLCKITAFILGIWLAFLLLTYPDFAIKISSIFFIYTGLHFGKISVELKVDEEIWRTIKKEFKKKFKKKFK